MLLLYIVIIDDSEPAISSTQHFDSSSDEGAPESSDDVDLYEPRFKNSYTYNFASKSFISAIIAHSDRCYGNKTTSTLFIWE